MVTRKLRTGKVVSTLMVLVLSLMFVLTPVEVSAQTTRGALCNDCNYGEIVVTTTYTDNVVPVHCKHGMIWDAEIRRYRITTYRCTYCGLKSEERKLVSYTVECRGFIW